MTLRTARRAVFLDRDGVINEPIIQDGRPFAPTTFDEFTIMPGVREACERLSKDFLLVLVTNQPEIARGLLDVEELASMHEYLQSEIPLDAIYVCPHVDDDKCDCRKPQPGLLIRAAAEHDIDIPRSFLVGDRWRDIEAGQRAGCRTILVDRKYAEPRATGAEVQVADLSEAADWLAVESSNHGSCA